MNIITIDVEKLDQMFSDYTGRISLISNIKKCRVKQVDCSGCYNDPHSTGKFCGQCKDNPNFKSYYKPKPVKKIIDLSMMAGSDIDIDMEFYKEDIKQWRINKLEKILVPSTVVIDTNDVVDLSIQENRNKFTPLGEVNYCSDFREISRKCRIRQDHWHPAHNDEFFLPEGLIIKWKFIFEKIVLETSSPRIMKEIIIISEDGANKLIPRVGMFTSRGSQIRGMGLCKLVAVKVTGIAENYRYEWQES